MLIIPFIGYLTNSFKDGFRLTAFFVTFSISIYVYKVHIISDSPNYVQALNIIILLLDIWALIHMYEKIRLNITDKLIELSITDSLTKLKNRTQFYQIYRSYKDINVCLILLDIDGLQSINEKYGNLDGDVVLMGIADILARLESDNIQVFRMGNDEFAVLIVDGNHEKCLLMAQNIATDISDCKIAPKHDVISVTASVAMTCNHSGITTGDQLMAKADKLLKQAKKLETGKIAVDEMEFVSSL